MIKRPTKRFELQETILYELLILRNTRDILLTVVGIRYKLQNSEITDFEL